MSFIDPLLAVQDVDMQIWGLQQELKSLPARKRAEENRLQDAAARLADIESAPEGAVDAAEKESVEAEIADVNAFISEIMERAGEIEAEIANLQTRRDELAKGVNFEHLRIYDRLRVSRHPTIVKLTNNTCGGCHLVQPPAVAHLIKRDNQLVTCEMCGRILY